MWSNIFPPLLYKWLRNPPVRKLYSSYDAALANCTKDGYEEDELLHVIYEKTVHYRDKLIKEE